jgi:hypothetical protein
MPAGPAILFTGWASQPISVGPVLFLCPGWADALLPRLGQRLRFPNGPLPSLFLPTLLWAWAGIPGAQRASPRPNLHRQAGPPLQASTPLGRLAL